MHPHLKEAFDRYLPLVEEELKKVLFCPKAGLAPFYNMMGYHLGWLDESFVPASSDTGKRLRPVLCLLSCQAPGGDPFQALPAAAAVEILHNFSLVHDDIEDNSSFRRHRPTVWKVWGIPHATNVGDGLFALAYLSLYRLAEKDIPAERLLAASRTFGETCLALCEGQFLDISFEERLDIGLDEYLRMIYNKTAALIACSVQLGAMLATEDEKLIASYRRFGENLGLAFQIQDDILGIWGRPEVTGKPAASDILQRKKTLPIVYAMIQERQEGVAWGLSPRKTLRELYSQEKIGEEDIPRILEILDGAKALDYTRRMAEKYHRLALEALESTGVESEGQATLRKLTDFLIERTY